MKKKIQDIATVRSGAYIKEAPNGDVYYLQVGDYDRSENHFFLTKPTLEWNSKTEKHLLSENDIVFAAKGTSNFCAVFHEKMGKVVASSSFLVVKVFDEAIINPDYLCWVLNREDTLSFLKKNAVGSAIPSISKTMIEEYEISVPSIQIQRKILEIYRLQQEEQRLYGEISNLRNKFLQQQLIKSTNNIISSDGE